jgi:hypothetical protein
MNARSLSMWALIPKYSIWVQLSRSGSVRNAIRQAIGTSWVSPRSQAA